MVTTAVDTGLLVDLLRESLASGGQPRLTIVSGSMSPLLRPGDQVTLERASLDQLRGGDIVVVAAAQNLYTHRLRAWLADGDKRYLLTRGDRTLAFDAPWPAETYVGRVAGRWRAGRYLPLGPSGSVLHNHFAHLATAEERLLGVEPDLTIMLRDDQMRRFGESRRRTRGLIINAPLVALRLWRNLLTFVIRGHNQKETQCD